MTNQQKTVQVNFFQLAPTANNPEDVKNDTYEIINLMSNLPSDLRKLERGDGNISLYGKLNIKGNIIIGTLVNNQMFDVPPSFDDETQKLKPLDLTDKQGLGYATCFLYDKETNILVIESTKNGVGPIAFTSYLRHNLAFPSFAPAVVINPKDLINFYNMTSISKFHVRIARVENGGIFETKKKSLNQIVKSADNTNTSVLEYKIQSKRKKSLALGKIRQWVKDFLNFKETDEVNVLTVTGTDAEDHREVIDFIKQRLKDSYKIEKTRLIGDFTISKRHIELETIYLRHAAMLKKAYKIRKKQN